MQYGLLGKSLSHSFSKKYFEEKFIKENLKNFSYSNFEISSIDEFPELLRKNPNLVGLNVTNPYKESVIKFISEISEEARQIGAVNCIKIENGFCRGYNTDEYGFRMSIKPFLEPKHNRALIFGTGGSSKAVAFALKKIGVECFFVTSSEKKKTANTFCYSDINEIIMSRFLLLINCTPVGMFPDSEGCLPLPFSMITPNHLAYDLIYNPEETVFLRKCREQAAHTINGFNMLKLQAEKSWEIWNS